MPLNKETKPNQTDHVEELHDDGKMKLSNDSDQYGGEEWDLKQNGKSPQ